jgi:D-glycero-D-manno-heptose 1,7-bisphosphate phosphatase
VSATAGREAVFLDRDGTIMADTNYVSRADDVRLLPGVGDAIRRINDAGLPVIVITNQSGIARGYFDRAAYDAVRVRLDQLLGHEDARIDDTFMCPHHPEISGTCECRKPGILLYRQAAEKHDLDPSRSWFIGDKWRDVEPALALGGHGILVPGSETNDEDITRARSEAQVAATLGDAVDAILLARSERLHARDRTG